MTFTTILKRRRRWPPRDLGQRFGFDPLDERDPDPPRSSQGPEGAKQRSGGPQVPGRLKLFPRGS
jgi:hypothetical protein